MNYKRLFVSNSIVFITFVTNKRREILQSNCKETHGLIIMYA